MHTEHFTKLTTMHSVQFTKIKNLTAQLYKLKIKVCRVCSQQCPIQNFYVLKQGIFV